MRTTPRRVLAASIATASVAAALTGCRGAAADDDASATPNVSIMVGGIDKVIYLPAMLTERLGYCDDAGVDVDLKTEPSGASAENVMLAGKVDGVVGFYDHTITLQAQDKCVESVVQLAKVPGEAEVVSTKSSGKVAAPADFTGKKLGVTSPGSSTDYLTQYLAKKNDIDPKDYTTATAGAASPSTATLTNGGIDAGM